MNCKISHDVRKTGPRLSRAAYCPCRPISSALPRNFLSSGRTKSSTRYESPARWRCGIGRW
eukprot:3805814-Pyramimonas_sp.AAC.1